MYSSDLKAKAIMLYANKIHSFRKVGKLLEIGKSTINRWCKQNAYCERKIIQSKITKDIKVAIEKYIFENPFITAKDIALKIKNDFSVATVPSYVSVILKNIHYTKKKPSRIIITKNVSENRKQFENFYKNINPEQLQTVDESAFRLSLKPEKGYCKKGQRLYKKVDAKEQYNSIKYSLLMGVTTTGIIGYKLSLKNFKTSTFNRFIENLNVPSKIKFCIMDNASIHKSCNEILAKKILHD